MAENISKILDLVLPLTEKLKLYTNYPIKSPINAIENQ